MTAEEVIPIQRRTVRRHVQVKRKTGKDESQPKVGGQDVALVVIVQAPCGHCLPKEGGQCEGSECEMNEVVGHQLDLAPKVRRLAIGDDVVEGDVPQQVEQAANQPDNQDPESAVCPIGQQFKRPNRRPCAENDQLHEEHEAGLEQTIIGLHVSKSDETSALVAKNHLGPGFENDGRIGNNSENSPNVLANTFGTLVIERQAHHYSESRQGDDGGCSQSPLVMTILCKVDEDNPVKNPILEDKEDVHQSIARCIPHHLQVSV